MKQIIECVPNFSEGQNPKTIAEIADAIKQTSGVQLLHITSDPDHNRTVMTFIGEPKPVITAAFAAIETASKLIDLNQHQGVHPRIGATDVCPLVPLKNISIEECNEYAEELAQKVANELYIPIYLYESSAKTPERQLLANIRQGNYEGLKTKIQERKPDFGPSKLGPAGATVIGVRKILIAYNINLESTDLKIAQAIAKKLREKDGGLKSIRALGLTINQKNCVQVSCNITDYNITRPRQVFDFVAQEAAKHHIQIRESELIGLIPKAALTIEDRTYLKFSAPIESQILEEYY